MANKGGEGGIRTLGTVACTTVFETVPIDHSGTSPFDRTKFRQIMPGTPSNREMRDMILNKLNHKLILLSIFNHHKPAMQ